MRKGVTERGDGVVKREKRVREGDKETGIERGERDRHTDGQSKCKRERAREKETAKERERVKDWVKVLLWVVCK